MQIAVVGGTGTLGSRVVRELLERQHVVRSLSRRASKYPVDLETGRGLGAAIAGCEAVIDASNASWARSGEPVFVEGTRRLLAAEKAAGVRHHVCVSIVGCDQVPARYYRTKFRQEQTVREDGTGWSIVRATQFHEFLAGAFSRFARWGIVPCFPFPLQTVACMEVAKALADVVEGPARHGEINVAGPEIMGMPEMVRIWRSTARRKAIAIRLPLWGRMGRALRQGVLTHQNPHIRGGLTFSEWLKSDR